MAQPGPSRPAQGSLRGSIRWYLPLLICTLLVVSVAGFTGLAYWDVQRASLQAARVRLQSVAGQLAGMLAQSAQQRIDEARRLAAHPALRAVVATPDEASRRAAAADLDAFLKASPQTLGVELWSAAGERLIARSAPPGDTKRPVPPPRTQPPSHAGITPLQTLDGFVYYEVIADVEPAGAAAPAAPPVERGAPAAPAVAKPDAAAAAAGGRLVIRRGASTPGAAAAIERLVGGGVIVRLGARGGAWTDLSSAVSAPALPEGEATDLDAMDDSGVRHLATVAALPGTPWLVWVAMDYRDATAAARTFVARMLPLGLLLIAIGSGVAWLLARRITEPLYALTHAAESLAAGDLTERVPDGRHDEIGRLAGAFNTMADRVANSYHELEERVRARTVELEEAMSRLKDTQDELVRREKLAMLGQLASGVGHELRNPLAVMTNAVYFLEMIQPDASPDVRDYHALLRAQIGLSEKIVSDLLDFARVKPPRRERISLTHVLTDQLTRLTLADGVRVAREIPPDLPAAYVDPIQTGQIVFNLLVNAVQAMEERGGVLTLRAATTPTGLRLDVIDTGPGVPAELQAKIFEALFTTKARGIGLGLAVSRSLAEANGGRLTVSSPPGEGATFTLTLPSAVSEAA